MKVHISSLGNFPVKSLRMPFGGYVWKRGEGSIFSIRKRKGFSRLIFYGEKLVRENSEDSETEKLFMFYGVPKSHRGIYMIFKKPRAFLNDDDYSNYIIKRKMSLSFFADPYCFLDIDYNLFFGKYIGETHCETPEQLEYLRRVKNAYNECFEEYRNREGI